MPKMTDESFYSRVAKELLLEGPIPGLWAKSFAESDGNEARAKALYLRLRVAQLKQVYEFERRESATAQKLSEQARLEKERLEQLAIKETLVKEAAKKSKALPFYKRGMTPTTFGFFVIFAYMLLVVLANKLGLTS